VLNLPYFLDFNTILILSYPACCVPLPNIFQQQQWFFTVSE